MEVWEFLELLGIRLGGKPLKEPVAGPEAGKRGDWVELKGSKLKR